jgi:hypothetical protein
VIADNASLLLKYTNPSIYEFSLLRPMQIYNYCPIYERYFCYNEESVDFLSLIFCDCYTYISYGLTQTGLRKFR